MSQGLKTPLFPIYEKHGAKTIDFGGWELPVQFSGIQQEHETVRSRAGLFDVSHMGEFLVNGADAGSFLQQMLTNDLARVSAGQAQYTLMCYPDGGVVDDLLVYKLSESEFMLVVNAANRSKDLEWLQKHAQGDVRIEDVSDATALLALQGPHAQELLQDLTEAPVSSLKSFRFLRDVPLAGHLALVSRTGYTGEDGFEIYVPAEHAVEIWELILSRGERFGVQPIGLGARDTLRFEAGLPLYGQELSAGITPVEAGLGFFVKPEKGDFLGSEVLKEQKVYGAPRKLVGLEMVDRGIPRAHYSVYSVGNKIGEVTTGTQSPTYKRNVGMALIDKDYAALGGEVFVEIRGKQLKAQIVPLPFYKRKPEGSTES